MELIIFIIIGSIAGIVMGTIGVGGGAIIITSLVILVGFPQKMAQGTTLFIVAAPISLFAAPISLFAAINYFRQGHVNIKAGIVIMISFFIFSLIGSCLGTRLPNNILKPLLGIILILMGIKLLFSFKQELKRDKNSVSCISYEENKKGEINHEK